MHIPKGVDSLRYRDYLPHAREPVCEDSIIEIHADEDIADDLRDPMATCDNTRNNEICYRGNRPATQMLRATTDPTGLWRDLNQRQIPGGALIQSLTRTSF